MKYILKVRIPTESGNLRIKDPQFGAKMKDVLAEVKAEAAYFGVICGNRGGYVIVNIDDASQLPAKAEPFFLWLGADVDFIPVMTLEDLGKAGGSIEAAAKKWGK
jgi:hypothetical protein